MGKQKDSDKVFREYVKTENVDFSESAPEKGDYENCSFINCNFAQTDLAGINFSDGLFVRCNLSMAGLRNTSFRKVTFRECKLMGTQFENCNPFLLEFNFEQCILDLSSFYKLKIRQTRFDQCSLRETDFTACDLTGSLFNNCDMSGAKFDNTVLDSSDFRTAMHYVINPENNSLRKAKFDRNGISGLLQQYDIWIE